MYRTYLLPFPFGTSSFVREKGWRTDHCFYQQELPGSSLYFTPQSRASASYLQLTTGL